MPRPDVLAGGIQSSSSSTTRRGSSSDSGDGAGRRGDELSPRTGPGPHLVPRGPVPACLVARLMCVDSRPRMPGQLKRPFRGWQGAATLEIRDVRFEQKEPGRECCIVWYGTRDSSTGRSERGDRMERENGGGGGTGDPTWGTVTTRLTW
jgi:hypothetical protein